MAKPPTKQQTTEPADAVASVADRETLEKTVSAITDEPLPALPEAMPMVVAEQVLIVSAPAGPRRRANLAFSSDPRELRFEELGPDPEETLEALRRDPMIKIDGRMVERPATRDDGD